MTRILLTEEYVDAEFGDDELGDGRALLTRVPVRVLRAETGRSVSTAHVSVGALSVSVELEADGTLHPWCAHCGVAGCAHVVAGLLALVDRAEPFGVGGAGRRRAEPPARDAPESWRRALGGVLVGGGAAPVADAREVALLFGVHPVGRDRKRPAVAVRPAVRGARGKWVRGGVSWREVADADDADPRWRALSDLEALHAGRSNFRSSRRRVFDSDGTEAALPWGTPEWIRLDTLPSRGLWEALRAAREAGVAFVADAPEQETVAWGAEPGEAVIDLRRRGESLVVEARVLLGEAGPEPVTSLPIGAPTVAVAYVSPRPSRAIALHPLAAATTPSFDALHARGEIVVPGEEIDDFVRDYLPELRDVAPLGSSDDSYDVPEPVPPELVLAVRHAEAGARLFWEWEYAPGERRQDEAEREVTDAVENAAGRFAHLLGREPGRTGFPSRDLGRDETVEFFAHVLPALRGIERLRIEAHDELPRYAFADEEPEIAFGVDPAGRDWLELRIVVTIQGEPVPSGALLTALARGQNYLRLMSGTVFPLTDPRFARLRDVLLEARALTERQSAAVRIPRVQVDLWQELAELGVISTQETAWLASIRALRDDGIAPRPVPESLRAELRDYQRDGFAWLDMLRRHRLGGLLADDMGLGKTVQVLAALEAARVAEPDARFLVVAPTSVVGHWVAEAGRFAPELRARAIGETSRKRGTSVAEEAGEARVLITSYAILRLDADQFAQLGVRVLVLDEAQNVKNSGSRGYAAARAVEAPTTFAITGTPLENNVMELFALMTLVAPGLFGTRAWFREHFHRAIERGDEDRMARLRERIRPFLLRRTKEEVAPELPPKTEQVLEVPLHAAHRRAYERRFRREQQRLLGLLDDVKKNQVQILAALTMLRRHALEPSFSDADEGTPSAKLDALGRLLDEIVADGHRVLVFSQFTEFLGLAAGVADARGVRYAYLDGSTSRTRRERMIERFQSGELPVFFLSLKAGGTGVNLTAADYCVLLDPWWNPAAEAQAIDRVHRIGQERPVVVYRLISAGTIEQKVVELQERKRRLFDRVLSDTGAPAFTADDYRALIQ